MPTRPSPPGPFDRGVTYASLDVVTVLAEAFQLTRVVDVTRRAPYLTGWRPPRPLSRPLLTPALSGPLAQAAAEIGYRVV